MSREISIAEAAAELRISTATLRNWVKLGVVERDATSVKLRFRHAVIENLARQIQSGEVARLRKRANKNQSRDVHAHAELLESPAAAKKLEALLRGTDLPAKELLYCLYVSALEALDLVSCGKPRTQQLCRELALWKVASPEGSAHESFRDAVRASNIAPSADLLGFAYQSLSFVGSKQKLGAYYTPKSAVAALVAAVVEKPGIVLDPCCGSGNFLVEAYRRLVALGANNPELLVCGIDTDEMAVLVARAALTLETSGGADVVAQVRHADALIEDNIFADVAFICSNPPWGAEFEPAYQERLRRKFPVVASGESFSYFIVSSLSRLSLGGQLGFLLPEAIINVRMHKDLRSALLTKHRLVSVNSVVEKFSGVFTKAVSLVVKNESPCTNDTVLIGGTALTRAELLGDPDVVYPLGVDDEQAALLRIVESGERCYLKGNADWALGVVTGDNKRFLSSKPSPEFEGVLKGTDVYRFRTEEPTTYLRFVRDKLQQVAPEEKYRAAEKLVYRFICKELVFAVERAGKLTLNSANVLIPRLPGHSLRTVCGILNSKLAQIYYQRKFNSIKTLRGNLEKFPFPVLTRAQQETLEAIVTAVEGGTTIDASGLDEFVLDLYGVQGELRPRVRALVRSKAFDY